ncbi:hypothetical protein J1N35_029597 [Gossypium stocksii]|uniref:PGG domain-containing protein n=1 Tax=Gossypium stocksii TaxID=47602 RepID=A0A9D3UYL6_9ROSI|nr:hypothetical protein J1N35_029597 [Gossypium stocksii]
MISQELQLVLDSFVSSNIDVKAKNSQGLTALEVIQNVQRQEVNSAEDDTTTTTKIKRLKKKVRFYDKPSMWVARARNNLSAEMLNATLVVAGLVITAVYQSSISPPGGVWQADNTNSSASHPLYPTSNNTNSSASHPLNPTSNNTNSSASHPLHPTSNNTNSSASHPLYPTSNNTNGSASHPLYPTSNNTNCSASHPLYPTSNNSNSSASHPLCATSDNTNSSASHPLCPTSNNVTRHFIEAKGGDKFIAKHLTGKESRKAGATILNTSAYLVFWCLNTAAFLFSIHFTVFMFSDVSPVLLTPLYYLGISYFLSMTILAPSTYWSEFNSYTMCSLIFLPGFVMLGVVLRLWKSSNYKEFINLREALRGGSNVGIACHDWI